MRQHLSLPHPATLRAWSSNIECEPGFLKLPQQQIADLVNDNQDDCIIILDEMSIKKQTCWDPKHDKFVGNVDYGCIKGEEIDNIAKNALVIMVSGLKKPWYVPLAYFLTDKLNANVLCQLITEAIKILTEIGANVHAVVFDGAPKNIAMAEKLGCKVNKLEYSFPHPSKTNKQIYVIFYVCHMVKLARNAFSDMKVLYTSTGERISWEYVLALYRAQQKDILHLGNKLKSKYVKWQNYKMKVSVAAQTFSHSVSAAITFLRNLKLKDFKDSKPTSDFILLMNDLFDMLNLKSKFGKNNKKPISLDNILDIEASLQDSVLFLRSLKDTAGIPLIKGPRQRFVIGFSISALSIIAISKSLLHRESSPFDYIPTYRFSQDTLEMFFSKIRGRFGWNNNPTALQFKYAMRSLLLKNKVEAPNTANCVLSVENEVGTSSVKVDSSVSSLLQSSNIWRSDVLQYISGYIVRKILQVIDCPDCTEALFCNPDDYSNRNNLSLISCKKYGTLLTPSSSVVKVVSCTDKLVRRELNSWTSFSKSAKLAITSKVLQQSKSNVFPSIQMHSMESHILDSHLRDDHITILIKLIVSNYLTLFLHQFGKVYTERIIKGNNPSRRNKLTKSILFYNE